MYNYMWFLIQKPQIWPDSFWFFVRQLHLPAMPPCPPSPCWWSRPASVWSWLWMQVAPLVTCWPSCPEQMGSFMGWLVTLAITLAIGSCRKGHAACWGRRRSYRRSWKDRLLMTSRWPWLTFRCWRPQPVLQGPSAKSLTRPSAASPWNSLPRSSVLWRLWHPCGVKHSATPRVSLWTLQQSTIIICAPGWYIHLLVVFVVMETTDAALWNWWLARQRSSCRCGT